MRKKFVLIVFLTVSLWVQAQSDKTLVRQGNKSYQSSNYSQAELDYRKALDRNPNSLTGSFNLGDAIYQQEDFQKAAETFAKIANADVSKEQKSKSFYNLGNSFLKAKQYEQSIEAYKMALRNNPADDDARYNLDYARQMLKKQQEQQNQNKDQNKDQQKDQNKDQQKDQQDKKDQQDQQKDQQDKKDQQQNNQDSKQNQDQKGSPEQQMNDQQSKQISKQDAEGMLEALKNNEKKTLEKLKKGKLVNARVVKKEKDW